MYKKWIISQLKRFFFPQTPKLQESGGRCYKVVIFLRTSVLYDAGLSVAECARCFNVEMPFPRQFEEFFLRKRTRRRVLWNGAQKEFCGGKERGGGDGATGVSVQVGEGRRRGFMHVHTPRTHRGKMTSTRHVTETPSAAYLSTRRARSAFILVPLLSYAFRWFFRRWGKKDEIR